MRSLGCAFVAAFLLIANGFADDYFVSKSGNDQSNGRSGQRAFATVGKGLSVLKPGDTLTVLPGEYFEANRVRLSGTKESPITIRAKSPGTALLRGDVDATGFERVPNTLYTWACPFEREVEGVAERDTAAMYAFVPSAVEVEDVRGSCYYDRDAKKLYAHTSDSASPADHAIVVSVTNGFGILIEKPRGQKRATDVVIDGLAFSGYMNREVATRPGGLTRWGLYIVEAERCTIRNCTAFLNGGGIGLVRPIDCVIENCHAFGNFSTFSASGGNIISWTPAKNTAMRNNVVHTTLANGIRYYGGGTENCVMEGNLAFNCGYGEIWIKGGPNATAKMTRNVSLGSLHGGNVAPENVKHNIYRHGAGSEKWDATNVNLGKLRRFDMGANFADPAYHDYRLQSDSVLRGKGPDGTDPGPFPYREEVFFVGPKGDDANKGTSVRQAWRTLVHALKMVKPQSTVYVLAGTYAVDAEEVFAAERQKRLMVRPRGTGRVLLGEGVPLQATDRRDKTPRPERCPDGFQPLLLNSTWTYFGPRIGERVQVPLRIEHARVHSVSATTANIEWWTPTAEAKTILEWGPTPDCGEKIENVFDGSIFHTVSLTGLDPNKQYYCRVKAKSPVWEFHTHPDLARLEKEKTRATAEAETLSFRTLASDPPPKTYHVSITGNDRNDGLSAAGAWHTIRHAAANVLAGDTVWIHGGTYEEHVPVRATGDQGKPVTFRAAPGEKVWMDGSGQKRNCAFRIAFKHHVALDGLYLHNFRMKPYNSSGTSGAIHVVQGSDNTVRRCFYDGRAKTYMPYFILANDSRKLTVENSVAINGWNGASFWRCPSLTIRNCVFYNGLIRNLTLFNAADQKVTLSHNLICDNIPQKTGNALVQVWHLEAYRGDHNAYFLRPKEEERNVLGFIRVEGKKNPGKLTLSELRDRTGQGQHSIIAIPGIKVVREMRRKYEKRADYERLEMHREGGKILPLDFEDFMTDPNGPCARASDGKPIGLDPSVFAVP